MNNAVFFLKGERGFPETGVEIKEAEERSENPWDMN